MDRQLPVAMAAQSFRELCYRNRDTLSAGIIVAGWDSGLGGQVYTVPLGGMCLRQKITIGGSGSYFISGYIDAHFRENMKKKECVNLVTNALSLAMVRDGFSGGVVRLGVIDKAGIERHMVLGDKLPRFYQG